MVVDLPRMARDGALLAVLASAVIMAALRYNPRFFMRHYPAEMRAATPPLTMRERLLSRLVALPLFAALIGVPWWSAAALVRAHPEAAFTSLWLQAFGVGMVFNLVDWLVLDEFVLGVLKPRWAMLPGAEQVPFRFDHVHHARGFVVGSGLCAVLGLLIAAILVS